jgi:ribonuclease BN (tRNA processing enzyme)
MLRTMGGPATSTAIAASTDRPARRTTARHKVVLLGTAGGSNPKANRFGIANAVVVDDHAYVVDCGEGVHGQLWRAGIAMHRGRTPEGGATVGSIFLTHLHSDHVIDLANLLLGFWPDHTVQILGPGPSVLPAPEPVDGVVPRLFRPEEPAPGTAAMVAHLLSAYAYNINVRIAREGRKDFTDRIVVREIGVAGHGPAPDIDLGVVANGESPETAAPAMEPVEILAEDERGVRVTAILVQHAPVFPALAYRFDTPGGSVVFSGDTGPCDNIARLATGANILVHEAIDLGWMAEQVRNLPNRDAVMGHLARSHCPPEDAGAIAARAGVGTLVLSHLVPGDGDVPAEQWEARVRPHFDGQVLCAADLDELDLRRPAPI